MSKEFKLDYTLSVPLEFLTEHTHAQTLRHKLQTPSTLFLDRLHPTKDNPTVSYTDEGIWTNQIDFQKDSSPSVLAARSQTGPLFASLDALCDAEFHRRFPNYQPVRGILARIKDLFPMIAPLFFSPLAFTEKECRTLKRQIAFSAVNRDDLISHPKILDSTLRKQLNLQNDQILQTEHLFAKNSPLNGQTFLQEGEAVHLSQAIACSNDRRVENTGNLRVVQTKNQESICYTGRADSERKALEQVTFLFFNELKTKGKGITQTQDAQGNTLYHFDYVVNSLLSLPPFALFPEREYLNNEKAAFESLAKQGPLLLQDPQASGVIYPVHIHPILFSRSCNFFNRFEEWFPPFITGQAYAKEISQLGYNSLKELAHRKLPSLKQADTIQSLLSVLDQHEKEHHLRPEEELLIRDYLCKLLNLPCIYHCKSSTDRTSIAIALSSALKQWLDLQLSLPNDIRTLIEDERFKELFAFNWMVGHQITRYARGAVGTINGERLNNENLGLSLSRGINQNPSILRLLPARYLTDYPLSKIGKFSFGYLLFLTFMVPFVYLPLSCFSAGKQIAAFFKNSDSIHLSRFSFPFLPLTLIFNFFTLFPTKVLNEASPQVGLRRLISGGKLGGKKDDER